MYKRKNLELPAGLAGHLRLDAGYWHVVMGSFIGANKDEVSMRFV